MNLALKNELLSKFRAHFGCEPTAIAYAPGRVEVLGNHTDYNDSLIRTRTGSCCLSRPGASFSARQLKI